MEPICCDLDLNFSFVCLSIDFKFDFSLSIYTSNWFYFILFLPFCCCCSDTIPIYIHIFIANISCLSILFCVECAIITALIFTPFVYSTLLMFFFHAHIGSRFTSSHKCFFSYSFSQFNFFSGADLNITIYEYRVNLQFYVIHSNGLKLKINQFFSVADWVTNQIRHRYKKIHEKNWSRH